MNYGNEGRRYNCASYMWRARHIRHMAVHLDKIYSRYPLPAATLDINVIIEYVERYSPGEIMNVNNKLKDMYNSGELSKRGRPPLSPNRERAPTIDSDSAEELRRLQELVADLEENHATPHNEPEVKSNGVHHEQVTADYLTRNEFAQHERFQTDAFSLVRKDIASLIEANNSLSNDIRKLEAAKPLIVHVQPVNAPVIDLGTQHYRLPLLIKAATARRAGNKPLNFWLYGPAGTGKSIAAAMVAKAFGLDYAENGKMLDKTELLGYRDGYGVFHPTQFYHAYKDGKLYCGDEIDGWSDEATLALNNALANGRAEFAGELVDRHPNFIFIGTANTVGKGGTIEYSSRFQHDAAFLDRFVSFAWPHDNALEDACCDNKEWLARVRYVRDRLQNSDIRNHMITMRASIDGAALLAAGIEQSEVEEMTLRKGLSEDFWGRIK